MKRVATPWPCPWLFLIDGAQTLRRAITDLYGAPAAIQRCHAHKYRNALGHLPERLHANVGRVTSALLEAEQQFRGSRGHSDVHHLISALDPLAPTEVGAERVA